MTMLSSSRMPASILFLCSTLLGKNVHSENIRGINSRRTTIDEYQYGQGKLWNFTSTCVFSEGGDVFVSASLGNDLDGFGTKENPYETIQYAVDNRQPCQTIYLMEGTYRSQNYDMSDNNGPVVNLNAVADLKITNYENDEVIIEFDGAGGFVGNTVRNFELSGVEIVGPNAEISYVEAISNRLLGRKRYTGRGVAIWSGDHIYIHDLVVHHCPGSGIRVNKGDYVSIEDSQVYSNTWWSNLAESAIVFAESKAIDSYHGIKMVITRNVVYDNVNKIPYYNKNYAWDYSPIGGKNCSSYPACEMGKIKNCPWQCRYGKKTQDYIIDGSGVYVTRNNDSYLNGAMELSNNTCYENGINGVVFHRTDRGVVSNNIIYNNGVVPRLDKVEPDPQDWHQGCSGKSRQPYSGLVLNNAKNVQLWNNRVSARYDEDFALILTADGISAPLDGGGGNKVCKGLVKIKTEASAVVTSGLGLSECIPNTLSPTTSPTPLPTACIESNFKEIQCNNYCHIDDWPHETHGTFPAQEAKEICSNACNSGDCVAFSLQFDNESNNGDRKCLLYKKSTDSAECNTDPFNTLGCHHITTDGQFFISLSAMTTYDVKDFEL